jgi:transglutaminase-like putative cysteine protease
MFIRLSHFTRYEYSQPVSFAPHALYLRPRETSRQRLHQFALEITPAARRVATNDVFDNGLDWAFFTPGDSAARLEFRSELMVETLDVNPFDFFLSPGALTFPFVYNEVERGALAACLTARPDTPASAVLREWLAVHLPTPPAESVPFLTALNSAVHRALSYAPRDEPGIQSATETMACGGGSCRDYAVFLIELCRSLGLAARFVSGYLCEQPVPNATVAAPQSMHAWAEVYLPGAGWRGLDPTRGIFCDDAFVPVAHAAVAESVNPIQGMFYGAPNVTSHLTTSLSVEKL